MDHPVEEPKKEISTEELVQLQERYLPQQYFFVPPFYQPNFYPVNGVPMIQKPFRITPCRNGNSCMFNSQGRCKFYHGPPLPDFTLRRKPCRFGDTCKYFEKGICNFYHPPTTNKLPDEDSKPHFSKIIDNKTQSNNPEDEEKKEIILKEPS